MAHLVETMAYVNETPWHGLGQKLAQNQPIETWLTEAGLDFTIKETDVEFRVYQPGNPAQHHIFNEQKVLYRSDTLAPLSVVSQRYQVVQPREILEFYRDLTEVSGFQLETAGVLKAGRKVWALAKTNQSAHIKGNDQMQGYLLLATACDGSLATTAQFTSVRVVCNNTLAISLNEASQAIKVPHNTLFDPAQVKAQLGLSVSSWDDFMYRMKNLAQCRVTASEAETVIQRIFNPIANQDSSQANSYAMRKVLDLFNGRGRGAELSSAKSTAFGLVNAVTEYVDHYRRARAVDNRFDSAWFGQGALTKQRALSRVSALIA